MENIWLISIFALAIGAFIGYLLGRSGGNMDRQAEMAEQLSQAQSELEEYKATVTQHFEETANLVNNLTNSYKEVHEHLASGAQQLCKDAQIELALTSDNTPKLEEKNSKTSEIGEMPEEEAVAEPPRDYAPKSPDEEGTLSENYGLKESNDEEQEQESTPPDTPTPREAKAS